MLAIKTQWYMHASPRGVRSVGWVHLVIYIQQVIAGSLAILTNSENTAYSNHELLKQMMMLFFFFFTSWQHGSCWHQLQFWFCVQLWLHTCGIWWALLETTRFSRFKVCATVFKHAFSWYVRRVFSDINVSLLANMLLLGETKFSL